MFRKSIKFIVTGIITCLVLIALSNSAHSREVRHGRFSPYARSCKAPIRSIGRIYLRGRREFRRNGGHVPGFRNAPGPIGVLTFRPQPLFGM